MKDGELMDIIGLIIGLGTLALSVSIAIFKGFKALLTQVQVMIDSMESRLTVRIDRIESRLNDVEKDVNLMKGMLSGTKFRMDQ